MIVIDGLLIAYTKNMDEAIGWAKQIKERNENRRVEICTVTHTAIMAGRLVTTG